MQKGTSAKVPAGEHLDGIGSVALHEVGCRRLTEAGLWERKQGRTAGSQAQSFLLHAPQGILLLPVLFFPPLSSLKADLMPHLSVVLSTVLETKWT